MLKRIFIKICEIFSDKFLHLKIISYLCSKIQILYYAESLQL